MASKNNNWVKKFSNKRNAWYMFNTKTAESHWCSETPTEDDLNPIVEETVEIKLTTKRTHERTPANDRLKRLQDELKKKQKLAEERISKKEKPDEEPETNQNRSMNANKTPNDSASLSTSNASAKASACSSLPEKTPTVGTKKRKIDIPKVTSTASAAKVAKVESTSGTPKTNDSKNVKKPTQGPSTATAGQKPAGTPKTAAVKDQSLKKRPGIISKLKQSVNKAATAGKISKLQESTDKKAAKVPEKVTNDRKSWLTIFKIPRKPHAQPVGLLERDPRKKFCPAKSITLTASSSLAVQQTVEKLKEQQQKKLNNALPTPTESASSSNENNFQISTQLKGGANKRLERLRLSLQQKQEPEVSSSNDIHNSSVPKSETSSLVLVTPHESSDTSTACDEVEPMDWESIEEESSVAEVPYVITSTQPTNSSEFLKSCDTMADYYDTLRDNLLRITASKSVAQNWQQDALYCVIDTNVLLNHLTFIEDLKQIKLKDSNGCIIFIPYVVLQELDKLKVRGTNESAKTLATRAIKYLNKQLEAKVENVRAQSAIEDKKRLIDVTSADDSIVNCCLQVKRHVNSIVLLSEDVNLRTKAIANDIAVTTKSDLV